MAKVVITGVSPHVDGEYEFEDRAFTNREWRTIKEISGVRPLELAEALAKGDNDLVVAFAKLALERNGKGHLPVDLLWDAPADSKIQWINTPQEEDARPPASPPASGTGSEPAGGSDENEKPEPSGLTLRNGSTDPRAISLPVTGTPV